jgi:hypothetical protein
LKAAFLYGPKVTIAGHKAEVEQLKGRIAELLDEKEQSEGQLKKVQGLLVTLEADAVRAKAEL